MSTAKIRNRIIWLFPKSAKLAQRGDRPALVGSARFTGQRCGKTSSERLNENCRSCRVPAGQEREHWVDCASMILRWWRYNPYLRYPALSLGLTVLLLAPVAVEWLRFQVSSETRVLLEGDQRNQASYERVQSILGKEVVVAINLKCADVFSPQGIDAVRRVSEAFVAQPGLLDVKSLTHSVRPVRRGLSLEMVPMVSRNPEPAELERLRQFALENPLVRNVMVSPDTRQTILLNMYDRDLSTPARQAAFAAEIEAILEPFREEGLGFEVLGFPLIEHELRETLRRDVGRFVPAALVVLFIILAVTFRSAGIITLVLLNQVAVMALLPGMIRLLGYELHVFSIMLFPLLAGIHLALLVHLYNAWQVARGSGRDADATMDAALQEVFKPSAFAALTTAIGLGSLTFSEVTPVREFGQLGAAGLGLVFFMSFGPGLALLALVAKVAPGFLGKPRAPGTRAQFGRIVESWVRRRRRWLLGAAGLVGLLSVAGLTRMKTDVRAVDFLNPASPTRQAVEQLDASYGGRECRADRDRLGSDERGESGSSFCVTSMNCNSSPPRNRKSPPSIPTRSCWPC